VLAAAFAPGGLFGRALAVGAGALLLAVVHAVAGSAVGASASGAPALAVLGLGAGGAAAALSALGARLGCPDPAASAVACAVLWAAGAAVWWVDDAAGRLPVERRPALRQAVLRVDWMTAAAYSAASYDRLRSGDVYARTTIGTLSLETPRAGEVAAAWGALAGVAALGARVRRAPRSGAPS
jgi:hypothetical protein